MKILLNIYLIQNLISNAIKAIGDKKSGIVEIDVLYDYKGCLLFTVGDNGKGINELVGQKMFELFKLKGAPW